MKFTILRNTVSGRTHEYESARAEKLLAHPVFGKVLVAVEKDKPEVLAPAHTVENGERVPVVDADEAPVETKSVTKESKVK